MGVISNGTTLLDSGSLDSGVPSGSMVLIKTLTASSSGTLSFVDGASSVVFDGTYKQYVFKFIDIHAGTENANFTFQASTNGGSGYGVALTSSFFRAVHGQDGSSGTVSYETDKDLAQSTGAQTIATDVTNENDSSAVGYVHLFNPSSTTFVKHFICSMSTIYRSGEPGAYNTYVAGYMNTTSAVDAVQFKMSSGNIDSGVIKLYGIS